MNKSKGYLREGGREKNVGNWIKQSSRVMKLFEHQPELINYFYSEFKWELYKYVIL